MVKDLLDNLDHRLYPLPLSFAYDGGVVAIGYDPHTRPDTPDIFGEIAYSSRRRTLGTTNVDDLGVIKRGIMRRELLGLPVYAYIHSGTSLQCGVYEGDVTCMTGKELVSASNPFSCRFDSGRSGYVFISREDVCKELGVSRMTKRVKGEVYQRLKDSVSEFNRYLNGEVYYAKYIDKDGAEDSIYSVYGEYDSTVKDIASCLLPELGSIVIPKK